MKRILLFLLAVLLLPAFAFAQPFQELDPRSIWLNGSKTSTSVIPFALGLSVPDNSGSPSRVITIGGTGPGASSGFYGNYTLSLFDDPLAFTRFGFLQGSAVSSGPGVSFVFQSGSTSAAGQPAGSLTFSIMSGGTNASGGGISFTSGTGNGAGFAGGITRFTGGSSLAGADYGYVRVGSSGTPSFSLSSSDARSSLYALKAIEAGTTLKAGTTLTVIGQTTLATSLDGLATLTAGVVGELNGVQGDLPYYSGTNTLSVLNKNTTATRYLSNTGTSNNPAWAQVDLSNGVTGTLPLSSTSITVTSPITLTVSDIGFDTSPDFLWAGHHNWSANIWQNNNAGFLWGDLANSAAAGIWVESGTTFYFDVNSTEAGSKFADLGYGTDTSVQGLFYRYNSDSSAPVLSLGFQDNLDSRGQGGGNQYPVLLLSSSSGHVQMGDPVPGTNNIDGSFEIISDRFTNTVTPLIIREGAGTVKNFFTEWKDSSDVTIASVDDTGGFNTSSTVVATGQIRTSSNFLSTAASNQISIGSGFQSTITVVPSGNRTVTIPDATFTIAGLQIANVFTQNQTISKATPSLIFTDSGGDDWSMTVTTGALTIRNTTDSKNLITGSASSDLTFDSVTNTIFNINGGLEVTIAANRATFENGAVDCFIDWTSSNRLDISGDLINLGTSQTYNFDTTNKKLNVTQSKGTYALDWSVSGALSFSGSISATQVTDSALTTGRVVIASLGGLLTDDADLTFSGGNLLTATNMTVSTTLTVGSLAGNLKAAAGAVSAYKPTLARFTPLDNMPLAANYATLNTRNNHAVLEFDDTTAETAVFTGILDRAYNATGLTITIVWMAKTATSGNVVWNAYIERMDTSTDLDADSFAAAQTATGAANGTSGIPTYTTITMTDGAQMDSLAVGEAFRIKIERDAANGSDTATGDAQILAVEIKAT